MDYILKLKDVSFRYSDTPKDEYVLHNLNYEFENEKLSVIKGASGSGKTTLLSLISGLETTYTGDIMYKQGNLRDINLDKYRNTYVGVVFQSYNLLPHLTAEENIVLSMDINGMKVEDKHKHVCDLMEKVGLKSSYANRRVLKLSGGEQQRIAIARSLSYDPDILIADEPTGNLDKKTEDDIMKIFSGLSKSGKSIIIVSHSDNVCKYADKIFDLDKTNKKD